MEYAESVMSEQEEETENQPDKYKFSCDLLCQKLNQLYQTQAKSKGVNLNIETSEKTDEVLFSKKRILQIAGNLISNSIKFTEAGGTVDVAVQVTKTDKKYKNNELTITVEDTGVGMTQEKIDEIKQGKAGTEAGTGGEKGYGFGLALVNHLVNDANGEMDISSQPRKGSKFTVTLPV